MLDDDVDTFNYLYIRINAFKSLSHSDDDDVTSDLTARFNFSRHVRRLPVVKPST